MNRITKLFYEVDLKCGHAGLGKLAAKHGVNVGGLKPGEHVLFVNKRRDKVKVMSHGGVLSYFKSLHGRLSLAEVRSRTGQAFRSSPFNLSVGQTKELARFLLDGKAPALSRKRRAA